MKSAVNRSFVPSGLPARGYCRRMSAYLAEMFPPGVYGALAVLLYADVVWLAHRLAPSSAASMGYATAAVLSILMIGLLARCMDEIKDKDVDARYHPHRPLPSGRVTESDLQASQVLAALMFLGCALTSPPTFGGAVFLLAYCVALSRHLWMRSVLERSPLLTLLTHSPLVALLLLYVLALVLRARGLSGRIVAPLPTIGMIGMLWSLIITAEIARKTRAPAEETGDLTYSRAWGRQPAMLAALAMATIALAAALYLLASLGGTALGVLPCLVGYAWFAGRCYLFRREPPPARARLGAAAQVFGFLVLLAFPFDGWLSR